MKIIIKEREVDYDTDYPNGWKFSAGDPFKVPVMINNYKCFVKRFEKKTVENISGWPLLDRMKGKFEPNLPRVYDCREVKEGEQLIHYVFYECIDGKTLEKAIEDGERIDLSRLTNDLFSGMQSIQKLQFWFADFCERNIFCEDGGRYLLVDLDSTEPANVLPNNEIYGSKDYWIPVYRYYKDILGKNDMRLDAISGASLNFLQIIFLILHLKQFYGKAGQVYKAEEQYDQLPALLASQSPAASNLFQQALSFKEPADDFIGAVRNIILHDLLGEAGVESPGTSKPVIRQFIATKTKLSAGESFTLSWQADSASKLELYRNGELAQQLTNDQTRIERSEFKDGASRDVSYHLVATNASGQTKSESIVISKKASEKPKLPLKWIAAAVAVIGVVALLFVLLNKKKSEPNRREFSVSATTFYESELLTIAGTEVDTPAVTAVLFNKKPGKIQAQSGGNMFVKVPAVDVQDKGEYVTLEIMSGENILYTIRMPYIPLIEIYAMESAMHASGASTITLKGKNLKLANFIDVWIRNTARSDSIKGTVIDTDKNKMLVNFERTAVFASLTDRQMPANNKGIIWAGFHQQQQPPVVIRHENPQLEVLRRRLRVPVSSVIETNISVSAIIDSRPAYYEEFKYVRIEDHEFGGGGNTLFDTVIFKVNRAALERLGDE